MNPRHSFRALLLAAAASIAPSASHAATYYWDGSANVTLGQSDNITTTGLNWLSGGLWDNGTTSAALASWLAGDSAVFGGSASSETITLGSGITVGNLTFGSGAAGAGTSGTAYTITGSTITLSSTTITTNTATTIASVLNSSSLTKAGAATLTLTGSNTISGNVTVNAGTLKVSGGYLYHPSNYNSTSVITVNSGATLELDSFSYGATGGLGAISNYSSQKILTGGTINIVGSTQSGSGDFRVTNGSTGAFNMATAGQTITINDNANDNILVGGTLTFGGAGNITINEVIANNTGSGTVAYGGSGTLTLAGANTFSGTLIGNSGTVTVTGTLRSVAGITANNGGTVNLNTTNLLVGGHGSAVGNGVVLAAAGTGKIVFGNIETRIGNVTLDNGGTLTSNRGTGSYDVLLANTSTGAATVTVSGTYASSALMNGTGGIHLQGVQNFAVADVNASGADLTVSMVLADPGSAGGSAGGINKTGAGTMKITSVSTYTGATTVAAGTLELATPDFSKAMASSGITVSSGAFLDVNGTNILYSGSSFIPITVNGGTVRLISTTSGAHNHFGAMTLNGGTIWGKATSPYVSQYSTFDGKVSVTGAGAVIRGDSASYGYYLAASPTEFAVSSGADVTITSPLLSSGTLLKSGAGLMTLSGANSNYSGGTTVRAGTLVATTSNALGSGAVTLNDASTGSDNVTLNLDATSAAVTVATSITVANQGTGTVTLGSATTSGSNAATFGGAITLNRDVTLNGGTAGDRFNLTGGIGGTGNLTIAGTKRVVLGGTFNTFAGTTTVNSGSILQLSDGSPTASSYLSDSHTLTVNGTLNLAKGANSETIGALAGSGTVQGHPDVGSVASRLAIGGSISAGFSGVLANGGASGSTLSLTKGGSGTQTLSGANTYTGATTVSNGVLNITGSLAAGSAVSVASGATLAGTGTVGGSVSVASGGVLTPGASGAGTLTLGSLTLGAAAGDTATINIGVSGLPGSATTTSLLQVNGNLVLNGGAGKVTLALGSSLANLASGTYRLINYNGTQLGDVTGFAYSGTTGARQDITLTNGTKAVDLVIAAAFPVWTGASTNNWSESTGAWKLNTTGLDTNFLTNDTVLFDSTASSGTVNLTADVAPVSVAFAGDTLNYTLGASGNFAITSGLMTKAGNSTLTINNANTFSGGTTITAGSVVLGDAGALGSGAIALSGGTLDLNGKTVTNTVVLGGGAIAGNGGSVGAISETGGARGLTVGSSLTLNGANSFTGAITISAGTLEVAGSGTLGGGAYAANIANAGALKFSSSANQTLSGVVSGVGSLTKSGNGTLTLTGVNTFTGSTAITAGTLDVSGSGQLGGGSYSQDIANDGVLRFSTSANQTLSGVVSGTGTLTKSGTGTLTLTGVNTFAGALSITAGTLDVSGSGQLRSGSYGQNIANAGILRLSSSANQTLSGTISGAGSLTKSGSGTLTLSNAGNNTFTGGTTLTQGMLSFASGNLGSSGAITMNGGTLQWASGNTQDLSSRLTLVASTAAVIDTNGNDVTFASAIGSSTSATLNKIGSGKLTLGAVPTYTGATTVTAGTLKVNFALSASLATPSITVASGGTLEIGTQDGLYYTAGKAALTINGGTVTINSGLRQTIANTINMTGGTLAATGSGDAWGNYSLFSGAGITATSDASGNAAVISAAKLALQDSGSQTTFNVTRGAATPASDLNVTGAIVNMNGSNNGLSKTGTGIMTVSGTNTYSGATTILGGTLVANSAAGLGTGTLNVNGGTLSLGAAVTGVGAATLTTGTISGSGSLSASSFDLQSGTVGAVLTGGVGVTKSTAGTVALNAANTYTGTTAINAGRLTIGVTNAIPSGTAITLAGGELVGAGGGTFTLTPASISLTAGTNRINNRVTGDTSLVIAGSGGLSSSATSLFMSGTHTYSGTTTISGSGYLEVSGASLSIANSVLNLTSTNTTRAVDIWAGRLTVRGLTGTGIVAANGSNGTIFSGPALAIVTPDAESYTFSGTLTNRTWNASGVMAVTKSGAGTQVLSGSNTYSGGTTITAGTLAAGSSSAFGSGAITLTGGTLDAGSQSISNAISLTSGSVAGSSGTLSGVISGTGALTKTGNGALTLSGNNSFSGGLTVSAGTLIAGSANALGTGAVSIDGGILQAGGASSFATGAITVNGGTLDLGGYALATGVTFLSGSITGASSYSGALALNGGTLTFADQTSFGTAAITVGTGATLDLAGYNPTNTITLNGGELSHYGSWNGGVSLAGTVGATLINSLTLNEVTVKSGATVDLAGVSKDIVYQGGTLDHLGSYAGTLTVRGSLNLSAGTPASSSTILVADGGAVDFGGNGFAGNVLYTGGTVANFAGDVKVQGTGVTLAAGSLGSANLVIGTGASASIGSGFSSAIRLDGGEIVGDTLNNFSGTVTVAAGKTFDIDGADSTAVINSGATVVLESGATLKGSGTVGQVTVSGGILSPGNSPGLLTTSGLALTAGSMKLEIASVQPGDGTAAVAGTDYDSVNVAGTLDLTQLSPVSPFVLNLMTYLQDGTTPGAPASWDPATDFSLAIFSYGYLDAGAYSGNISVLFQINSIAFIDGFGQQVSASRFSVIDDTSRQQLRLVYSSVPEPSTYGAFLGGLALAAAAIRRRRKAPKAA